MDLKTLSSAIGQIAAEKGIDANKVIEAIEFSVAAAYKKEYRQRSEIIRSKFDAKSGDFAFWQIKTVVDDSTVRIKEKTEEGESAETAFEPEAETGDERPFYNLDRHIFLEEARVIKADAQVGEELEFPLEVRDDFGRIAAQTAKQVVLQKLREAERESIQSEFSNKEGEIVSGIVQRFERGNVFVDLGRAIGVMFYNESIPGERYRIGERFKLYVLAVQEEARLPGIILSRAHPMFVSKLFELEVPEIADKVVEVKAIAREPGNRTKIALYSTEDGVDPVGAAVGQRGTRVMAVTNELGNEKIDIIEWSEEPEKFIANSLSPAKVKLVEALPRREAKVLVAEDQLSLAIGKGGQNVRLAAKLTGWKLDVRSQSRPEETLEGGVAEVERESESDGSGQSEQEEGRIENDKFQNPNDKV